MIFLCLSKTQKSISQGLMRDPRPTRIQILRTLGLLEKQIQDDSLNVSADSGNTPHYAKHIIFVFMANPADSSRNSSISRRETQIEMITQKDNKFTCSRDDTGCPCKYITKHFLVLLWNHSWVVSWWYYHNNNPYLI